MLMACPNFIAPPLSSPSTLNSCSAVRACTSAATLNQLPARAPPPPRRAALGRPPADALAETEGGAAGESQGKGGELRRPRHGPSGQVSHGLILPVAAPRRPRWPGFRPGSVPDIPRIGGSPAPAGGVDRPWPAGDEAVGQVDLEGGAHSGGAGARRPGPPRRR